MIDISNRDEAEAWLDDQPQDVNVVMAVRSALRVLPPTPEFNLRVKPLASSVLPCCRAILTGSVAAERPTDPVRQAANTANADATAATDAIATAFAATPAFFATEAATATDAAASAADYAGAADAVWLAFSVDASVIDAGVTSRDLFLRHLWADAPVPIRIVATEQRFLDTLQSGDPRLTFFHDWYQGMVAGTPMNWDMFEEIALIPDGDWKAGATRLADQIEEIRSRYFPKVGGTKAPERGETAAPPDKTVTAQRIQENKEAIATSIAAILEQISERREKVRGNNQMDAEVSDALLAFLDDLTNDLARVMQGLPQASAEVSEEVVSVAASWRSKFTSKVLVDFKTFSEPERVADTVVPVGVILGCTSVGAMLGGLLGAGAGAVIGKTITGELKPGEAAEKLLDTKDADPSP